MIIGAIMSHASHSTQCVKIETRFKFVRHQLVAREHYKTKQQQKRKKFEQICTWAIDFRSRLKTNQIYLIVKRVFFGPFFWELFFQIKQT